MEFLIALLFGLAVFSLGYNFFYLRGVALKVVQKRVVTAYAVEQVLVTADPQSVDYKLAAAGIRASDPRRTWLMLHWLPPAVTLLVCAGLQLPFMLIVGVTLIAFIAPRRWLEQRAKDRGLRIEEELPSAYVRLGAILRASQDVAAALRDVSNLMEESKGMTPLAMELRQTASDAVSSEVGRTEALRRLQQRAASPSLANLALLLERFAETAAGGQGGTFYEAFESAAENVQSILEARQKAKTKAAEQMMAGKVVPILLGLLLLYFTKDPEFRLSFHLPIVQVLLGGTCLSMFLGYLVMSDIAREAV